MKMRSLLLRLLKWKNIKKHSSTLAKMRRFLLKRVMDVGKKLFFRRSDGAPVRTRGAGTPVTTGGFRRFYSRPIDFIRGSVEIGRGVSLGEAPKVILKNNALMYMYAAGLVVKNTMIINGCKSSRRRVVLAED